MLDAALAPDWRSRKPHGLDAGIYAPLPKRGTKAGDAPAFGLAEEVMRYSPAHMARGFVAMGFLKKLSEHPRVATPLFDISAELARPAGLHGPSLALRLAQLEWPVFLMARAEASAIYVCTVSGDWVSETGGARGRGFCSLMAFMKNMDVFRAAAALLRANGYKGVPRVAELGR